MVCRIILWKQVLLGARTKEEWEPSPPAEGKAVGRVRRQRSCGKMELRTEKNKDKIKFSFTFKNVLHRTGLDLSL